MKSTFEKKGTNPFQPSKIFLLLGILVLLTSTGSANSITIFSVNSAEEVEPGEKAFIEVRLENQGNSDIENVKNFLSKKFSIDPNIIFIYKNSKELVQIFK